MSDTVTNWREHFEARRSNLVQALEVPDEMVASAGAQLADLFDARERYAFTLGVLENVVQNIAERHHCDEPSHCGTCFQLRSGLAAIVALDQARDAVRSA